MNSVSDHFFFIAIFELIHKVDEVIWTHWRLIFRIRDKYNGQKSLWKVNANIVSDFEFGAERSHDRGKHLFVVRSSNAHLNVLAEDFETSGSGALNKGGCAHEPARTIRREHVCRYNANVVIEQSIFGKSIDKEIDVGC